MLRQPAAATGCRRRPQDKFVTQKLELSQARESVTASAFARPLARTPGSATVRPGRPCSQPLAVSGCVRVQASAAMAGGTLVVAGGWAKVDNRYRGSAVVDVFVVSAALCALSLSDGP